MQGFSRIAPISRTQKSAWGVASGLLYTVISVSAGFLAIPWLLDWLGSERFGAYKVLTDWMGYLALCELGLGSGLIACLTSKVAQGDTTAVRNLLTTGLNAFLWVTLAMFAGGIGLVVLLPYVLSLSSLSTQELQGAGMLFLVSVLFTPLLVFRALAEARQYQYLCNLLMLIQSLLLTGLLLATAWMGWGLPGQALATVVAQVPAVLILTWHGLQAYGCIRLTAHDPSVRKALWGQSRPAFVHTATDRVGLISDNIIIAWLLGPVAVASFYLTQQLAALAQSQLKGLSNATWAGLVELYVQGQGNRFRLRLFELTTIVSALGIAALSPIAAYNHHFIRLWVGNTAYAGEAVTLIVCINAWFWSIYSLWGWPLLATGNIRNWTPYAVACMGLNVVISILATLEAGLAGPLIGSLAGFLIINAWALPRVLHRTFALSPWLLWRSALTPFIWGLPYAAVVYLSARFRTPQGWVELAMEMVLAGLGGLLLWWTQSLNKAERIQWWKRLRIVLGV